MSNIYFRVTYDGIGVYEALKRQIWAKNDFSKEKWEDFRNSKDVNWLKKPRTYGNDYCSYFTEFGFMLFMKKTYPFIIKWLDKNKIKIEKNSFDKKITDFIYQDEHQVVILKDTIEDR